MTSSPAERAISELVDSLFSAWNRHDARAFAQPFAADADFTNVFGMHATGRDAIAQFHAPIFETMFKDSHLAKTSERIRLLRGDVAAIDVGWEVTGARDPLGQEWPRRRGLINLVATSDGQDWSFAVMHNMDLPPDELAEAQDRLQRETPRS